MANLDKPVGFRPVISSHTGVPRVNKYVVKASEVAIAAGDAVIQDAGDPGYVKIALSSSGSLLGIAAEGVASTAADRAVYVYDDPNTLFIGQTVTGQTTAQDDLGGILCDIAGTTGIMEVVVNTNTESVIAVLFIDERPDNTLGEHVDVIFKIYKHALNNDQTA